MERPLRLTVELSLGHCQRLRDACRETKEEPLANLVDRVATKLGNGPHPDFNQFVKTVAADASEHGVKLTAKRKTLLQTVLACREETASGKILRVGLTPHELRIGPLDSGAEVDANNWILRQLLFPPHLPQASTKPCP